jgi:hypothetical protein
MWAWDDATVLTANGAAPPASITVTLVPGWNLISNQTTTSMPGVNIRSRWLVDGATALSAAITANTVGGTLYWWNGSTDTTYQVMTDTFAVDPWKAYWILNLTATNHTLTIRQ